MVVGALGGPWWVGGWVVSYVDECFVRWEVDLFFVVKKFVPKIPVSHWCFGSTTTTVV